MLFLFREFQSMVSTPDDVVLHHQIKTLISFLCSQRLNLRSLIQHINDVCYRPLWVLILEFIPLEILILLKSSGQSMKSFAIFLLHGSLVR